MELNKFRVVSVLAASMVFCMPIMAQAKNAPTTWEFVQKASSSNQFEIDSSKLALQKTSAQNVKDFAQMMIADHTQMGDQMKEALASSGTGFSPAKNLSPEDRKTMDQLTAAPASAFDNLYVQAQSHAHDEAVNMFTNYADNGDNDSIKRFASDSLPVLKKHQNEAHNLSQGFMSSSK
jgi:putative membrane protein